MVHKSNLVFLFDRETWISRNDILCVQTRTWLNLFQTGSVLLEMELRSVYMSSTWLYIPVLPSFWTWLLMMMEVHLSYDTGSFIWNKRGTGFLPLVPPLFGTPLLASTVNAGPTWSRPWASVTHHRLGLYLQRRSRKQLVNPFSLRPLICSYLLQQPKKSRDIFSFLLLIDPALRKSALLSKHYWSPPPQRQPLAPVYKGTGGIEISFPTTSSSYFSSVFSSGEHGVAGESRSKQRQGLEPVQTWNTTSRVSFFQLDRQWLRECLEQNKSGLVVVFLAATLKVSLDSAGFNKYKWFLFDHSEYPVISWGGLNQQ